MKLLTNSKDLSADGRRCSRILLLQVLKNLRQSAKSAENIFGICVFLFSIFLPAPVFAEEAVDEITVYGKDKSKVTGEALSDTREYRAGHSGAAGPELQSGLSSRPEHEFQALDTAKPELTEQMRAKPDLVPETEFILDFKIILLMGLLAQSGE